MKNSKTAIEKFNETLAIWITGLHSFTLEQLLVKPDDTSWSLGQLYEHLIEETNWYNGQIEISLDDVENSNVPTTVKAQKLLKNGSFPNERILGDPLISENVKQPSDIDQLRSDLAKLGARTNETWDIMTKAIFYGKSEHPEMGYLNCFEWLQYSEMHLRHHLNQKNRIAFFLREREYSISEKTSDENNFQPNGTRRIDRSNQNTRRR